MAELAVCAFAHASGVAMHEYGKPIFPLQQGEIFCSNVGHIDMAGPGVIRFYCVQTIGFEQLPRATLLFPINIIPGAIARASAFVACQMMLRGSHGGASAIIH